MLLLQAFDTELGDTATLVAIMLMDMPSCKPALLKQGLWVADTTSRYQDEQSKTSLESAEMTRETVLLFASLCR